MRQPSAVIAGGEVLCLDRTGVATMRSIAFATILALAPLGKGEEPKQDKPLSAAEASKRVNEKVVVEMLVKASKNRLEKRQEIYLDSEEDFRDPKNLGVVINVAGAAKFKDAGIEDPAEHFKGKTIRVTGTVTKESERPRIVVEDPKQIQIVEKK
jgi:DNA/RNA endonuclease YhcR with UshA esterase domain